MKKRGEWFLKLDWQGCTELQQAQYLVRSFLVFAARDVRRAYIFYYDDNDSASVHGASGLTRKFAPKPAFWAVKQLYETLGEYRFNRTVENKIGELFVYEFVHGGDSDRIVWVAWSPTGARTNEKDRYTPREVKTTLNDLPGQPLKVVGMATADGVAPNPSWEKAGPSAITLNIGESPTYIIMDRGAGKTN
jgi:hypothetical protein